MKLIGISGKMGCGKNYIAEKILSPHFVKEGYQIFIIGFGDLMKFQIYSREKSFTYDELYDKKTTQSRQLLQKWGMEMRNTYGDDIWIRGIDIQIETFCRRSANPLIIICDVRFRVECDYISSKGGKVIRIESPERTLSRYRQQSGDIDTFIEISQHISETDLDEFPFHVIVNNDIGNEINLSAIIEAIHY
jgi:phosphomevalonate kinase